MSWLSKAYSQLTAFPNIGHDDAVDALVGALGYLDKAGYLRGKVVPEREIQYWSSSSVGTYS